MARVPPPITRPRTCPSPAPTVRAPASRLRTVRYDPGSIANATTASTYSPIGGTSGRDVGVGVGEARAADLDGAGGGEEHRAEHEHPAPAEAVPEGAAEQPTRVVPAANPQDDGTPNLLWC